MKNNFINKVEKINILIDDKQSKITQLNDEIEKKKKEIEELKKEYNFNDNHDIMHRIKNDIVLPKYTDYDDANILYGYRVIKKSFNFDYEKVIKDFLEKEVKTSNSHYMKLLKIREYFNYDLTYKLMLLKPSVQKKVIFELLSQDERELVKDLTDNYKFSIRKFLEKIDEEIVQNDPKIRIYVGEKKVNYNSLNENIETIFDETITEGFKIIYKGTIYDYSI